MQTALKFFDFFAQSHAGNLDKVAIKLPDGSQMNSQAATNFMEMLGTMIALDPEQVQASLGELEKVPLEGDEAGGFARLIDLSGEQREQVDLMERLLGRMAARQTRDAGGETDQADCPGCDLTFSEENAEGLPEDANTMLQPFLSQDIEARPEKELSAAGDHARWTSTSSEGEDSAAKRRTHPLLRELFTKTEKPAPKDGSPAQTAPDLNKAALKAIPSPATEKTAIPAKPPNTPIANEAAAATELTEPMKTSERNVRMPEAPMPRVTGKEHATGETPAVSVKETAKATGLDRALKSVSEKPSATKTAVAPPGQQNAMERIKGALDERPKMPAEAPRHNFQAPEVESAEKGLVQAKPENSDVVQKIPAGREGFQSLIARAGEHQAKSATAASAETLPNEPSKELQNDVMRQIVQRMTLRTQGTHSKMQIHLKPEFLGHVHMQISTDQQQVVVRMTAESIVVKEMIEQHLAFLKTELQQHGLEIDKFDVQVGNDSEGWKNSQDPSGFRQALKNGQQEHQERQKRELSESDQQESRKSDRQKKQKNSEIDYFA